MSNFSSATKKKPRKKNKPRVRYLDEAQSKFCFGIVMGLTQTESYEQAYPGVKHASAMAAASALKRNDMVVREIKRLRTPSVIQGMMSRELKRDWLRRVVLTGVGDIDEHSDLCESCVKYYDLAGNVIKTVIKMPSKMAALAQDNMMTGDNEPIRVSNDIEIQIKTDFGSLDKPVSPAEVIEIDADPAEVKVISDESDPELTPEYIDQLVSFD